MSVFNNLLKNGFASSLQKALRVLEQLSLVPFFISSWGAEYYGEWLTLSIIPSVLGFSDLGFGTAAANTLVLRYASEDRQGAANIAKCGFLMISLLIVFGIFLSTFGLIILYKYDLFSNSVIEKHDAIVAISLIMAARLINFYQQLFDAFFRSARKAAKSIQMLNIYTVFNIIGGIIVLYLGGDVIDYASVTLCVSLFFNPTFAFFAKRELKLKELKSAKIIRQDLFDTFKKGLGYLMTHLWQAIYFQGTILVVRLVLGPAAVSVFNTVRTLSRSVNQLYSIINASIFPELQFQIGKGNWEKARKIFRGSIAITLILAFVGMFFLFFFGSWFYEVWTNNTLNPPVAMWNIFIIGIGFNSLWWTSSVIFRATNKPFEFAFAGLIASVFSVFCTYFFTKIWGLEGAALGTLVMEVLLTFYVLPKSTRLLRQPLNSLLMDTIIDLKAIKFV